MTSMRERITLSQLPPSIPSFETRDEALHYGIAALEVFYISAKGQDRARAIETKYFLLSVLRNPERPMSDVVAVLEKKSVLPGVSQELRDIFSRIMFECSALGKVRESSHAHEETEDLDTEQSPSTFRLVGHRTEQYTPVASMDMQVHAFNTATLAPVREDGAMRLEQQRDTVRTLFQSSPLQAEKVYRSQLETSSWEDRLSVWIEEIVHTYVEESSYLSAVFGFDADVLRDGPNDVFFQEYFAALDRAGYEEHECRDRIATLIRLRGRLAYLLRKEAEALERKDRPLAFDPEKILGVDGASVTPEALEHAYLVRLQMLDPDGARDSAAIAELHRAREILIQKLNQRDVVPEIPVQDLDQSPSFAPKRSRRSRAANISPPMYTVATAPDAPADVRASDHADEGPASPGLLSPAIVEQKEGWLSRTFRAPGRMLRMMFGATALATAGGIALHEFSDDSSERQRVVQAEEMPTEAVRQQEGLHGPAEERLQNDQGDTREHRVLANGDSVWKTVVGMLRDRHLSTSNASVQYYTHQALVDNHLTAQDAMALKPGDTLDVTNIARMMDAIADGGDTTASMEPVAPVGSEPAETESISGGKGVGESASVRGTESRALISEDRSDIVAAIQPYSELPSVDHAEHVMVKGESVYKLVHQMLRSRGLNWTTERINFLTQLVVDKNADRFRDMVADGRMRKMDDVWIPVGASLDFSDAVAVVDDMERAKNAGKKAKTVRELAKDRGYKYPIMMTFPK